MPARSRRQVRIWDGNPDTEETRHTAGDGGGKGDGDDIVKGIAGQHLRGSGGRSPGIGVGGKFGSIDQAGGGVIFAPHPQAADGGDGTDLLIEDGGVTAFIEDSRAGGGTGVAE